MQQKKTARGEKRDARYNSGGQFRDDDDVLKEGGERDDGQMYYQYASARNPPRFHSNYDRLEDEDELEGGLMADARTMGQT